MEALPGPPFSGIGGDVTARGYCVAVVAHPGGLPQPMSPIIASKSLKSIVAFWK